MTEWYASMMKGNATPLRNSQKGFSKNHPQVSPARMVWVYPDEPGPD